ncbi:MAG: hypothetical protein R3A10_18500 [Caldilineaceae bacterium]
MIAVLEEAGFTVITLTPQDTEYGSIESLKGMPGVRRFSRPAPA